MIDEKLCVTEPVLREKLTKASSAPTSTELDVPDSWYGLLGDISNDPIAQSLMLRLKSGTVDGVVAPMTPKTPKTPSTLKY